MTGDGTSESRVQSGGCHCGRVRFRVLAKALEAVDCNCSICSKKGFLHWIVPEAQFELLTGTEQLTSYEFNTRTAKHLFCRMCGVHAFYRPRSHPNHIDVNVLCLDEIDPSAVARTAFDGRNWEANVDRIR